TVFSAEHVRQASQASRRAGRRARVHLKVETGMGRIGARPGSELMEVATALRYSPEVSLEGAFTHFACADAPDKSYTKKQFAVFVEALETLSREGFKPGMRHCANSAATIDLPETHLDMVRPGLSIYGYLPSELTLRKACLKPCLEWKTRIVHVKRVPPGAPISYGSTYVAPRETVIATVPVGYADGYPRALSNRGEALFRGRRVRIAGRVCMDQMMLDLGPDACGLYDLQSREDRSREDRCDLDTGKTVKKGSNTADADVDGEGNVASLEIRPDLTVTLLGRQGDDAITADEMARWVDTIPHEILTGIGSRVPRVYTAEDVY
ncbi:MAG TPA: alanine racemase, partial [Clostridia bacterium]|nr:alanine racemase [Clostridia bacterium]